MVRLKLQHQAIEKRYWQVITGQIHRSGECTLSQRQAKFLTARISNRLKTEGHQFMRPSTCLVTVQAWMRMIVSGVAEGFEAAGGETKSDEHIRTHAPQKGPSSPID